MALARQISGAEMLAQPRPVLGIEAGKLGAQCPICRAAFVGVARA
jgi:hypothetical protein